MNKNKKIVWGVVGIIILVAVFYGGMVYGKSKIPMRGQGAQTFGANGFSAGAGGARGTRNSASMGGFTTGQIISKDANSITVSIQGGGSKIIFLDSNTKISKSVDGTTNDLMLGTEVSVTGTPNTDGSENATSVQIRSANPVPLTK